jgi:hypothetical protein
MDLLGQDMFREVSREIHNPVIGERSGYNDVHKSSVFQKSFDRNSLAGNRTIGKKKGHVNGFSPRDRVFMLFLPIALYAKICRWRENPTAVFRQ